MLNPSSGESRRPCGPRLKRIFVDMKDENIHVMSTAVYKVHISQAIIL